MPDGYRTVVVNGNGRLRTHRGRERGPGRARRPARVRCRLSCRAAGRPVTSSASWTPTPRSTRSSFPASSRCRAQRRPWHSAGAGPRHGTPGPRTRASGNDLIARRFGLRDIGPRRAARRKELLGLGLTGRGDSTHTEWIRLRNEWQVSDWFRWSHVSADAIGECACAAGLNVAGTWTGASRSFAELIL
jgi:hypothetical protein